MEYSHLINLIAGILAIISFVIYIVKSIYHYHAITNPIKELYSNSNINCTDECFVIDNTGGNKTVEYKINFTYRYEKVKILRLNSFVARGMVDSETLYHIDGASTVIIRTNEGSMKLIAENVQDKEIFGGIVIENSFVKVNKLKRFINNKVLLNIYYNVIAKNNYEDTYIGKLMLKLLYNPDKKVKLYKKYKDCEYPIYISKLYVQLLCEGKKSEYYLYFVITNDYCRS